MQKSFSSHRSPARQAPSPRFEPAFEKGPKFEPFYISGFAAVEPRASMPGRRFDHKR